MSTVASLDRSQRHLIDVRLDSLDRILLDSGVTRSERLEIVQAVEDQILEMLDRQDEEVTRESVLQLLSSLDPPEAYCSEEAIADMIGRSIRGVTIRDVRREVLPASQAQSSALSDTRRARHSGLAIASFVLAMLAILTLIVFPVGAVFAVASFVCGVIALPAIAASHGRVRGTWMAIFGCATFTLHFIAAWCLIFLVN